MNSISNNSQSSLNTSFDGVTLDEDHCSRPCLSYFEEKDACAAIIESTLGSEATSAYDYDTLIKHYDPVIRMLNKYMAQPQLLDPHLPSLVEPIFLYIRTHLFGAENLESKGAVFYLVYHIALVRKPKFFLKYFPHEASDVEKLIQLLNCSEFKDYKFWYTRYVLLLWLSYVMMLPFNIRYLLKSTENESVVDRILNIVKPYLSCPGKEREASAFLIGKLLSRSDVIQEYLPKFIDWMPKNPSATLSIFTLTGLLQGLCNVLKFSDRQNLLPFVQRFLPILNWLDLQVISKNNVLRKLIMKCTQRIGMVLLKQKLASWRYQRGSRSLAFPASVSKVKVNESTNFFDAQKIENDEDDNEDIPEEIEHLVNVLFVGLKDTDTIVRWSAAKGFGRIAYRLPKEMAEEILFSIFQMLKNSSIVDPEGPNLKSACDSTWHGACLTIAEFTRRGIILPSHLSTVIYWIEMGLTFELRKGHSSIGSNVRDGACFVCWSIARGYAPEIVKPFVHRLAPLLVSVAVFDREVNVRRAASAAFQENVGRQGVYPHGIDIVTATDFYIIGNRQSSYLEAGPQVAKFPEYHPTLLNYLLKRSLQHWDESIRHLASKSCRALVHHSPSSFQHVFDELLPLLSISELPTRHGALLGLAESMLAAPSLISPFHLETLWKTVMSIQDQHLHSFGSEHTRNGLCRLIECLSIASPIGKLDKTWVQNFFKLLESSWERKEESLQLDAAQAAGFLIKHVSQNEAEAFIEEWCDKLCTLTTPLLTKIGLTRVLGMVAQISTATLTMALNALINTMQLPKDHSDATLRKSVMISLGQVLHESLGSECISSALKCFQKGLEDYTITAQGDIGSWVRMAAMEALLTKAAHIDWSKHPHSSFHLFLKCLFQCLSRIDKVRCVASQCTQGLLPYFKHLPDYTFLTTTLFRTNEDWSHSLIAFQSLVPLLELDTYRDTILFGYLLCIGAGSVSTERDATEVLLSFIEAKQCEAPILYKLAKSLVSIYNQNVHGTERNLVPFFSALHLLYCNQSFSFEMTSTHDQFFEIISRALQTTSSVVKLNLLLKCCCCFMSIPSTCHRALQLATQFLIHEVPRLRKAAAEQILIFLPLYLLNMHDDVTTSLVHQGKNDTSFMLLIETDWTQSSLESLQDTCQRFITSVT